MPTITLKDASPQAPQQQAGQSARDRAIARLTQGSPEQAQAAPVANPSSVSVEELGALATPEKTQESRQNDTSGDPTTEASQEATPAKVEETPLSSQYAILARKEKAHRAKVQAQEAALRTQEAAIKAREEAIKAKESEYQTNYIPKSRLAEDTLAVLSESGLSYDQITQLMLNQPTQQDPQARAREARLEAKLQAVEEKLQKQQQSYEEGQTQAYKQAVSQIRNDTKALVQNDPTFETIKETNSIDDVVELIEETFKTEGVLLTVEEAAQAVEDHLVEEAIKIAKLKKIQQRLQPKPAPTPEAPKQSGEQQAPKQQTMKTLTNAVGTSRQLSARERAILAFKGEKN